MATQNLCLEGLKILGWIRMNKMKMKTSLLVGSNSCLDSGLIPTLGQVELTLSSSVHCLGLLLDGFAT